MFALGVLLGSALTSVFWIIFSTPRSKKHPPLARAYVKVEHRGYEFTLDVDVLILNPSTNEVLIEVRKIYANNDFWSDEVKAAYRHIWIKKSKLVLIEGSLDAPVPEDHAVSVE